MPKRKRGFGLGRSTPKDQKKKYKRIRGDDGGNKTLDLSGVRGDKRRSKSFIQFRSQWCS